MSSLGNAAVSPHEHSLFSQTRYLSLRVPPCTHSNDTESSMTPGKGVWRSRACHPHSRWRGLRSLPGCPTGGLGSINTFALITADHSHALISYFRIAVTFYMRHMPLRTVPPWPPPFPLDNLFLTAFSKSHLCPSVSCSLLIYRSEGQSKRAYVTMSGTRLVQKWRQMLPLL